MLRVLRSLFVAFTRPRSHSGVGEAANNIVIGNETMKRRFMLMMGVCSLDHPSPLDDPIHATLKMEGGRVCSISG